MNGTVPVVDVVVGAIIGIASIVFVVMLKRIKEK